jgi:phosphatidylinositol-3-phosphatase
MTRRVRGIPAALAVIGALGLTLGTAEASAKTIVGTKGPDRLVGTRHHDRIAGRGGADHVRGRRGADTLRGGAGRDRVVGGKGFDHLVGGRGRDFIRARDGHPDTIDCGPGHDVAVVGSPEDGVFNCEQVRTPKPRPAPPSGVPHFKHVFIVVLENENASSTFGKDSEAPYLSTTLRSRGAFVPNYYGIGHESLDNYIAMVSGQAPNFQTQADCQFYTDFTPGTPTSDGQYLGSGCVYPAAAKTVANQLEGRGLTWKGYMEDMNAAAPKGKEFPCRHPDIGQRDPWQSAEVGDQYATRHNPFVYFHSIIDSRTCQRNDVDFSHLRKDLRRPRTTPDYSFITPNLCHDGHDSPCVGGAPGGLKSANWWLHRYMPMILRSPAFQDRGLLIVTFDEAEGTGSDADSSACCNEQPGPNVIPPNTPGFLHPGPGGGRVGAVMVSPCIRPGTVSKQQYNHYSLLRSIERNFQLPYLGYAGQQGLRPFGTDILSRPSCRRGRTG